MVPDAYDIAILQSIATPLAR